MENPTFGNNTYTIGAFETIKHSLKNLDVIHTEANLKHRQELFNLINLLQCQMTN